MIKIDTVNFLANLEVTGAELTNVSDLLLSTEKATFVDGTLYGVADLNNIVKNSRTKGIVTGCQASVNINTVNISPGTIIFENGITYTFTEIKSVNCSEYINKAGWIYFYFNEVANIVELILSDSLPAKNYVEIVELRADNPTGIATFYCGKKSLFKNASIPPAHFSQQKEVSVTFAENAATATSPVNFDDEFLNNGYTKILIQTDLATAAINKNNNKFGAYLIYDINTAKFEGIYSLAETVSVLGGGKFLSNENTATIGFADASKYINITAINVTAEGIVFNLNISETRKNSTTIKFYIKLF